MCWPGSRLAGIVSNLGAWEDGSRCRPAPPPTGKPGLTVPLTGANYVNPRAERPPRPLSSNGKHEQANGSLVGGAQRHVGHSPTYESRHRPAPAKVVAMPDSDPNALAQALLMTQQSLAALQRMQEQTAALHKQFLESQETAQRTLQSLVEQQQTLLLSGLGAGVPLPAMPLRQPSPPLPTVPAPVPVTPVPVETLRPAATAVAPVRVAAASNGTHVPARDRIAATLLAVVSEKTGYPAESLDLSLSLDADLGVDSIKRVEILAALQEKLPDAPVVKPEHLGTLHTLRDVAEFLAGPGAPAESVALATLVADDATDATTDRVTGLLMDVIAEKTGYPASSLNPAMSLDADLGVDSIKRVEILAAIKEKLPDAPEVKAEHIGSLHTIRDVAEFLSARSGLKVPSTAKIPILQTDTMLPVETASILNSALTPVVAIANASELNVPDTEHVSKLQQFTGDAAAKKGRGSDVTRPLGTRSGAENTHRAGVSAIPADRVDRSILQAGDLDLNTPRPRISLPGGGEIWVVGDLDPLSEAVTDLLIGHGFKPKLLGWSGPGTIKPSGPLAGLVLLAPLAAGPESGLNRQAFAWLKLAAPKLRQAGRAGAAVFVTVARLDGAFGLANLSADANPAFGGLAGLVKTARHEWPEVACKAIDLDPTFSAPQIAAAALVDEILSAGPTEVGIARTHRCTLDLARTIRRPGPHLINLGSKDVILITGGARGVTAEAAVALAETYSPTLILTGRTPLPGSEPEWLAGLTTEVELKKAIAEKLGPDAGPRRVGEQYHLVVAQREVRRTLERIASMGAKVAYFPVNITDGKAVADLLQQVRAKFGPVTALVHGAGVLADRRIEDLTAEQFDHVYTTKVDGLRNLLDLLTHEELKALILFSSTTARFGRTGQVAYACANEVLNKTAQVEARRRPGCRVVSINWGPWDGGMVTPALRKLFEGEGVGVIPLLDGAVFLVQELNAAGKAVEVIAVGKSRGGSGAIPIPAGMSTSTPPPVGIPGSTGSGVVASSPAADLALAFERVVDVVSHPVLKAHVLDGRAVLPMALHLEWLAHAALHGNPGLVFHGFNDLRVTHGVHVDSGGTLQIRAFAGKAIRARQALPRSRGTARQAEGRAGAHPLARRDRSRLRDPAGAAGGPPAAGLAVAVLGPAGVPRLPVPRSRVAGDRANRRGVRHCVHRDRVSVLGTGRVVSVAATFRLGGRPARARRQLPDDDPLDAVAAQHRLAPVLRGPIPAVP